MEQQDCRRERERERALLGIKFRRPFIDADRKMGDGKKSQS